jgi:hypothetical protein
VVLTVTVSAAAYSTTSSVGREHLGGNFDPGVKNKSEASLKQRPGCMATCKVLLAELFKKSKGWKCRSSMAPPSMTLPRDPAGRGQRPGG